MEGVLSTKISVGVRFTLSFIRKRKNERLIGPVDFRDPNSSLLFDRLNLLQSHKSHEGSKCSIDKDEIQGSFKPPTSNHWSKTADELSKTQVPHPPKTSGVLKTFYLRAGVMEGSLG